MQGGNLETLAGVLGEDGWTPEFGADGVTPGMGEAVDAVGRGAGIVWLGALGRNRVSFGHRLDGSIQHLDVLFLQCTLEIELRGPVLMARYRLRRRRGDRGWWIRFWDGCISCRFGKSECESNGYG